MKALKLLTLPALLICIALLAGCKYNSEDELFGINKPCDTTNVTFGITINSIINANGCTNCHTGPSPAGNFTLTGYADIKAQVDNGKLWGAINHLPGFSPMPQGGSKLTQCEIDRIQAWINAGAPDN
jgi:hypothetical protein